MQVKFNENNIAYVVFHKWDYGQELSFDSVPDNSEVHFPVRDSTDAVKVKVVNNKCSIPNSTLTLDLSSFDAWLYINNREQGRTKKIIHFTLNQRPKPEGHIYNFEEDKVLDFNNKLDKFQGAENAGKTFIVDDKGNARIGDMPKITVDCKLSENSNNPIANSAVTKVLSGGKLKGIEIIFDYESFMDMFIKYCDPDTGEFLLADDEFIIVFALDDIYDESGEYNDDVCLVKKALYFWTNYDMVAFGEVSDNDLSAIVGELHTLRQLVMSRMTAHFVDASKNGGVYCSQFSSGITQITKDGPLYSETTDEQLLLLKAGDTVFSNGKSLTYKVIVVSSRDGEIHTFNKSAIDGIRSSQYIDKAETETLIDEKLSVVEVNVTSIEETAKSVIELKHNSEQRQLEQVNTSLSLSLPENIPDDYISGLVFNSGETPVTLSYPESIVFTGDDVTDNVFVPKANKTYDVVFWYNGVNINAISRGVLYA